MINSLLEEMEGDIKSPNLQDSSLKEMSDLCAEQLHLEEEISELESQLKSKNSTHRKLSQEIIPAKMSELGLESITLKDGAVIKVKQLVQASIPVKHREEAFKWLRENRFADLIKNTVSVSFGRDEDDSARELREELTRNRYTTAQKQWVEPMTLKAFVREQVEKGTDLPYETFNIYIGQKSKIKRGT